MQTTERVVETEINLEIEPGQCRIGQTNIWYTVDRQVDDFSWNVLGPYGELQVTAEEIKTWLLITKVSETAGFY